MCHPPKIERAEPWPPAFLLTRTQQVLTDNEPPEGEADDDDDQTRD